LTGVAAIRTGDRVVVREPRAEDAPDFISRVRASVALHRGLAAPPGYAAAFDAYLARCGEENFVGMLVCHREDGRILGVANLSQIFRGPFQNAFLGYYAFAGGTGHGWMTEGIGLALDHAFHDLGLHRVEANVQPGNDASVALLRRLGFSREGFSPRYLKIAGRWRDHERWAILAEEWTGRWRRPAEPG
jgi:[ribosomal protein S5]-alanine N-acetyltransferase